MFFGVGFIFRIYKYFTAYSNSMALTNVSSIFGTFFIFDVFANDIEMHVSSSYTIPFLSPLFEDELLCDAFGSI